MYWQCLAGRRLYVYAPDRSDPPDRRLGGCLQRRRTDAFLNNAADDVAGKLRPRRRDQAAGDYFRLRANHQLSSQRASQGDKKPSNTRVIPLLYDRRLRTAPLSLIHRIDDAYGDGVLSGALKNGFYSRPPASVAFLPWTVGSIVATSLASRRLQLPHNGGLHPTAWHRRW